nr:sorting nexin-2-like [Mirounga angustirostris]
MCWAASSFMAAGALAWPWATVHLGQLHLLLFLTPHATLDPWSKGWCVQSFESEIQKLHYKTSEALEEVFKRLQFKLYMFNLMELQNTEVDEDSMCNSGLSHHESNGDVFDIEIGVSDPEKVGDGMNAYMAYRATTKTSLSMFSKSEFSVKRRFSDFLGLHSKLASKYLHVGYIVAPAPEKSIVGMTKVKVGKEDSSSTEFVEKRRAALARYLQRIVKHPTLLQDPDLRQFLESSELPRAVTTQALSGAGILRMVNKAADAVNKMTIKMNESDAWFEEKQQQFDNLDQQLRKLHASVEVLVCHRKELSANTAAFAKSAAMLGNSEDHTALSRALSQLVEVEEKIDQLHQEQAFADFYMFSELLSDYIRLIAAVKGVFDHRMKCWQKWEDAQITLLKKRETKAKMMVANKPDKIQQTKSEIREWEAEVQQGGRDFEQISKTILKEVGRFEKERVKDFKTVIIKYLESLVQTQQQLIKYWEAFLPEAKAIA